MVHLDEPDPKVLVQQEVKAEQLEAMLAIVGIHSPLDTEEGVDDDVFDAGQQ